MKVVIQCSGSKAPAAGIFKHDERKVKFVARPELHPPVSDLLLSRPDEAIPNLTTTWREHLVTYNESGENPDKLLPAGRLYSPVAYHNLVRHVGPENLFILSAGWGLVRSSFLLPDYDITFSSSAERWQRRHKTRDSFDDFNHLKVAGVDGDETVYFFGGMDYLPLYYDLTRGVAGRKVVYTAAASVPKEPHYDYIDYGSKGTNWHYRCVTDFIAGQIPK